MPDGSVAKLAAHYTFGEALKEVPNIEQRLKTLLGEANL